MGGQEDIEYLKSLVNQLNEKIAALESKAKGAVAPEKKTPAQQLRTILVGPPGAGMLQGYPTEHASRMRI
jgi:adenylate kinase